MPRSSRRHSQEGRFTVSGPFEEDHPAPSVGAGISCAQTFASRHHKVNDELTYYVRDLTGRLFAMVTKRLDGVIVTTPTEGRTA